MKSLQAHNRYWILREGGDGCWKELTLRANSASATSKAAQLTDFVESDSYHSNICGSALCLFQLIPQGPKEKAKISSYLNFDISTIDYLHNAHYVIKHQTEFLTVI